MAAESESQVRRLLIEAAERGAHYLEELAQRPVYPAADVVTRLADALAGPLPDDSTQAEQVLSSLDTFGSPATVASAGGRYFGFVTGGALPASLAANWLATAWDQNAFSRVSSPAGSLFEETSLRWLRDVLRIPAESEAALVTGATMANFTCLAAARHEVLRRAGWDVEGRGLFGAPEVSVVVGEEVHATVLKVLGLLGLGRDRIHKVAADGQGRMRAEALPKVDGPAIVCIQAGNVNTGSFDPAELIVEYAHARGAWVHVDGAFGLWASASKRLQALTLGFEQADSWATDAHKWLNVPYDCGAAFVRSPAALRAAMSISGSYLLLGDQRNAIDVSPEGSRRARGVEVWAALQALGRSGLAELIERNCRQAAWLAGELEAEGATVLNDVVLNQILVAFGDDAGTERTIAALEGSGEAWCGGTTWKGRRAMRISISSWATTQRDVERTLAAIRRAWHAG